MTARELYTRHVADQVDPKDWDALTPREQAGWEYAASLMASDTPRADGERLSLFPAVDRILADRAASTDEATVADREALAWWATQWKEARDALKAVADHMDEFAYDELATVLDDEPSDHLGEPYMNRAASTVQADDGLRERHRLVSLPVDDLLMALSYEGASRAEQVEAPAWKAALDRVLTAIYNPASYTCPTACVEHNHPGREHPLAPTEDRGDVDWSQVTEDIASDSAQRAGWEPNDYDSDDPVTWGLAFRIPAERAVEIVRAALAPTAPEDGGR